MKKAFCTKAISVVLALFLLFAFTPMTVSAAEAAAPTATPMVAAGRTHSAALDTNGNVWTWGWNGYGQLGDASNIDSYTPVKVKNINNVTAVAAGNLFSAALKSDGTVWAWGSNYYGQLGDASNMGSDIPVKVTGLTGVKAIAAGFMHMLALKSDGTVWAWGRNEYGQIGNKYATYFNKPMQVRDLNNITAIAAGRSHNLAVKSDGSVWAWGYNEFGQLGDGGKTDSGTPVQVKNLSGVIAVAGGAKHSIALKSDGNVWTWGGNDRGQLGDGGKTGRVTPVKTPSLSNVAVIGAGADYNGAIKYDGSLWMWGCNEYGQLGLDNVGGNAAASSNTPVKIQVSGITALSVGYSCHAIALESGGSVLTWGRNDYGQLGDKTTADHNKPSLVLGENGEGGLKLGESSLPKLPVAPKPTSPAAAPKVTALKLSQSKLYLARGKSAKLPVAIYKEEGAAGAAVKLKWTSSNKKIASVTQTGKITGVKPGKAKITITAPSGKKRALTVYVVNKASKIQKVTMAYKTKTMKVGGTQILKGKISPATATGPASSGAVIKWKSSNIKVLKVDAAGRVTALKKGRAKITVSAGAKTRAVIIKVK